MAELPDRVRGTLAAPHVWSLATVNPDGSPQATVVWVHPRDDRIIVNSALGRKKARNIARESRVALCWHDPTPGVDHSIAIQGRVVDTIHGDEAEQDADRLAGKYMGVDVYPWRAPGERRVTFVIEPTHVFEMGP
jgi:PPOX class probable F420-dependent enzyme